MKAKASGRMFFLGVLCVIVSSGLCRAVLSAPERSVKVEFRCKIVPPSGNSRQYLTRWRIQIKASSGKIVRTASAMEWQTIRFRNLEQDIYMVCLVGAYRSRCESVDMYAQDDHPFYLFFRDLSTPASFMNMESS